MKIDGPVNIPNTEPPNNKNKTQDTDVNHEAKTEKVTKDNEGVSVSISPEALEKGVSIHINTPEKTKPSNPESPIVPLNNIQKAIKIYNEIKDIIKQ